jgi:signal transduction histidine kinase
MNAERRPLMVVDDEPDVLRTLHDLFRKDYRVLTYTRATEALGALAEVDVPVVLSDQRMPGLSGVEFLRRVKQLRPETTRLLFTGYSEIKTVIDAINEGHVFRYIAKPWNSDELAAIVRQAMEHRDLIVERRRLVAELKETNERLAEANRLKGAFIEVASHELNTPVAVTLGIAELWRMHRWGEASATERAWIERIQSAGRRLAGIVERMIKLLQAGQFEKPLDIHVVDVEPLVRGVLADLQPFFGARGQQADLRVAPGLGAAEIDASKVEDILTNLVVNAIKFSPDGSTIRIEAARVGNDRVRFRIADAGIGIPECDHAHLFEPFFTGYDTLHHSSGEYQFGKRGLGLGLSLVKRFAELHGGSVEVCSRPGAGTAFSVTLPLRPAEAASDEKQEAER